MIHAKDNPVSPSTGRQWLFWDGDCGFCRESVRWLEKHDRADLFLTVPYQDAPSPPMTTELRDRCRKAVVILTSSGDVYSAGQACAMALESIGYRRLGRFMQWPVTRTIVEWGYRWVARNRGWLGKLIFRIP